jgi:hypothetical protein
MLTEGMPLATARLILRHAQTIQRCAELECSSEAADRDRVPCPGRATDDDHCLCRGYGSYDSTATTGGKPDSHGTIPRIARTSARSEAAIEKACAAVNAGIGCNCEAGSKPCTFIPHFNGDPRGAVVKLSVPSGRTDDWGREGICVPTR